MKAIKSSSEHTYLLTTLQNLVLKIREEKEKEKVGSGKDTEENLFIYGKHKMAESIIGIIQGGLRSYKQKHGEQWYG